MASLTKRKGKTFKRVQKLPAKKEKTITPKKVLKQRSAKRRCVLGALPEARGGA